MIEVLVSIAFEHGTEMGLQYVVVKIKPLSPLGSWVDGIVRITRAKQQDARLKDMCPT
jgi:hypothetical protein